MDVFGNPVPSPVDIIIVPHGTIMTLPAGVPSLVLAGVEPEVVTERRQIDTSTGLPTTRFDIDTIDEKRTIITTEWKEQPRG